MNFRFSFDKVQMFSYFIFLSLIGSVLLSCPFAYKTGYGVPYIDALFTAVSAVCVTGLSSVSMDIFSSAGFIVIMLLIEFGGLGVISFIALAHAVPKKKVSFVNRAIIKEFYIEDIESEPRKILSSIIVLTFLIEGILSIPLFFSFMQSGSKRPLLDAVFHSISAFCNAGFSTYNDSLISYSGNYVLMLSVIILIMLGGIGFVVLSDLKDLVKGKKVRLSFHSKIALLFTGFLVVFSATIFFLLERNGSLKEMSVFEKLISSIFMSVTPRTAGFNVVPMDSMKPVSAFITSILMFIGGSPGSIAGGVKTTTFYIAIMYALRGNPNGKGLNIGNRNIDSTVIEKAFNIVSKSLIIITSAILLLLITEAGSVITGLFSIFDIFFETISAFATVGLSMGITASLSNVGKLVIILVMFIGRTGLVAMALMSTKNDVDRFVEYPSASIMIG